ncbi:hypothetical protein CsSME_00042362 [Camellia sinensis var. sinensis]
MERIHRLRQKANDSASQVTSLQTELGRAKSSLQIANADNDKLLGQLGAAKQERDTIKAKLEALKQSREKDLEDANNASFKEAEESYTKQVHATQDIYFKAGWKTAYEQLGQGLGTDIFASPPAIFLLTYLVPYANDIFAALQAEAKEEGEKEAEGNAQQENHPEQPGAQDQTATINLEVTEDEFSNLSPLA